MQRVGRGSFGEVYRAFDPTLQRYVALKLLLPRGLDREDDSRALLAEARALARIRHPNVVPIFGVDEHDGRVGFWTDFVQGTTLEELVARQGPFGPREAALVGIDLCLATGAVHAAGLVHRDIKTGNVMREEGGRILLMDFGLTHASGALALASGTPAYMAPELLGGGVASVSSDVYAIGVLLFNLLTAQYPIDGSDFGSLRAAHAGGAHRSVSVASSNTRRSTMISRRNAASVSLPSQAGQSADPASATNSSVRLASPSFRCRASASLRVSSHSR
jgi:serine/threonine protein kinase